MYLCVYRVIKYDLIELVTFVWFVGNGISQCSFKLTDDAIWIYDVYSEPFKKNFDQYARFNDTQNYLLQICVSWMYFTLFEIQYGLKHINIQIDFRSGAAYTVHLLNECIFTFNLIIFFTVLLFYLLVISLPMDYWIMFFSQICFSVWSVLYGLFFVIQLKRFEAKKKHHAQIRKNIDF